VPSPRVILYARPGCHLCEEVSLSLDEMLGPESYTTVDIESDDELLLRYGHRIPVVALDGVDRVEAPIAGPDLRALIRSLNT
jgi:glutaredoxin